MAPARVFEPSGATGVMMEMPLTVVAYAEIVSMADDGSVTMNACWKDVSRVRLLSVVRRCIVWWEGPRDAH